MGYDGLAPAFAALLALGGQVLLPILILTTLYSKRLNRHSTFVNFCVTLILYSLIFCLLIYTGKFRQLEPDRRLCEAQASLIMAILPTVIVAALMIVVQTWATFQGPGSAIFMMFKRPCMRLILLATPYVTFFAYLLGSIVVIATNPDPVWALNGLHCFFKPTVTWYYLGPLSCLVLLAVTGALEVIVMVQWYWQWHSMKKAYPLAENKAQLLICSRACLFSVYTWLALAITTTIKAHGAPSVAYFAEAGVPLAAFLVFATQKDILQAWGIRRAAPQGTSVETNLQVSGPVSAATENSAPLNSPEP